MTQTALTWRFTKSASELARPNKSKLCYIGKKTENIGNVTKNTLFNSIICRRGSSSNGTFQSVALIFPLMKLLEWMKSSCFMNFFSRMVFCVKDPETQNLTQEVTFVKCKDAWRTNPKRTPKR